MNSLNKSIILAFIIHCGLILAFAILGGFLHAPVVISASIYAIALVSAYFALQRSDVVNPLHVAKRLVVLHLTTSSLLLVIGVLAEKTVPLTGGALTYIALMTFYIVNSPGLLVSKLLPYPGNPELVWEALGYISEMSVTAIWLYVAFRLGGVFSSNAARNA